MKKWFIFVLLFGVFLSGCATTINNNNHTGYTSISQEKAIEMMKTLKDYQIVDVRREDEFKEGHIEGAVLIPNESIQNEAPKELSRKDQTIFVYCRSGNRSRQAAKKLAALGYTKVYEMGGIGTWPGKIVR
ncbi:MULTISPECIES: rhodanese-like domain-containing protein [Terrabacteria group]|uniref:rhodanese-like domain-containing protein n=1 Tax=Bacillati TaxID=1783272 RepID=UPI0019393FA0|nr:MULTISPECIES: rhodanese-like domain-containing protein [Terrabacteria group]MBW9212699.1 rhodanese-like domain-containing protein [Trueperella sp. zg.1013]QRG86526.1 rhodanese-like domain-containing protein [Bulleidia sp. zg-1006]